MQTEARKALASFLPSMLRDVVVSPFQTMSSGSRAHLVRGGCTLAPDAYLFTVN